MDVRKMALIAALAVTSPFLALAQASPPQPETKPPEQPPVSESPNPPPVAPPAAAAKPAEVKPSATVGLYGTVNVNTQLTSQQGVSRRAAVSTDSTNIGVRGSATLNEWLRAELQCETSANLDGIGPAGICGRNSRVALGGEWGTLWYGNWDTPFKGAWVGTKADDPFQNTDVFDSASLMSSPGFNYRSSGWKTAADTAIAGFDVRASNSIGYWTPKIAGLGAKLQYSVDEFRNAKGDVNPQLYGAALNYDVGPFSAFGSYEYHEDSFALVAVNGGTTAASRAFGSTAANAVTSSSADWAWRVGAGYELGWPAGATTVSAAYEQLRLGQDNAAPGAVKSFKRPAFQVGLKHRFGMHELRARYSKAEHGDCSLVGVAACSTAGYGADDIAIGYALHLAKTTQVYLTWVKIRNDANAQYTFSIGGASAVAGATARGADPVALALGVRHAF
jgi:predicted porin